MSEDNQPADMPKGLSRDAAGVVIRNRPPWETTLMSIVGFGVVAGLWDSAMGSTGIAAVVFAVFIFAGVTGALSLVGWGRARIRVSRTAGGYTIRLLVFPPRAFTRSSGLTRGIEGDARRSSRTAGRAYMRVEESNSTERAPTAEEARQQALEPAPLHVQMENLYITLDDNNRFVCRRRGTELNAVQNFLDGYLRGG